MKHRWLCLIAISILLIHMLLIVVFQYDYGYSKNHLNTLLTDGESVTITATIKERTLRNDNHIFMANVTKVETRSQSFSHLNSNLQVYLKETDLSDYYVSKSNISEPKHSPIKDKTTEQVLMKTAEDSIHIGSTICFQGYVRTPKVARNPGNFCQSRYFEYSKLDGTLYATKVLSIRASENKINLLEWLIRLRMKWSEIILASLGEEDGGLLSALLLGERHLIDPDTRILYQKSGIGHILAISGLHISFIGLAFLQLFRLLRIPIPLAVVLSVILLLLYVLMVGLTPSTIRALVMFGLKMGAILSGKRYDLPTSLGISSVIVLLWRPKALFHTGFQFSFVAVLGLILWYPLLMKYSKPLIKALDPRMRSMEIRLSTSLPFLTHNKQRQCLRYVLQAFAANLSITLFILPILLYHFYEFSSYTIWINLLILPLLTIVIACGLLGSCAFVFFPSLANVIFAICRIIFSYYDVLSRMFLAIPGSRIVTGQPRLWQVFGYYGCFLVAYFILRIELDRDEKQKKNLHLMSSLVLAVTSILLIFLPVHSMSSSLSITMMDVGQGDGIHIRTPHGSNYLIDGGSLDIKQVGIYRMEPYLLSQGVTSLEYVFISHDDEDHHNGIIDLIRNRKYGVRIQNVVLPPKEYWKDGLHEIFELAIEQHITVYIMGQGDLVEDRDVLIQCLAPKSQQYYSSVNNSSMILSLQYKDFTMLLTGDMEQESERDIVNHTELNSYDVLKVAHHGSKTSSSSTFLELIKPRISLISSGVENRFGHPHIEVLERLVENESLVLQTNERGAIQIMVKDGVMKVHTYLSDH